jgi:hypothetical protein
LSRVLITCFKCTQTEVCYSKHGFAKGRV